MEGRGLGAVWGTPVLHLFLLFFVFFFWFGLFLMLVVCVHACVFIPLTLLRVCLDTRLPGESRDDAARGDALVSKSDCLVVDEQSGR